MRSLRRNTTKELRCFCSRGPLLAVYGVGQDGKLFIHVKIYKQSRIFGEILVTDGTVSMRCRECFRWHRINIIQPNLARLEEMSEPPDGVDHARPALLAPTADDRIR